MANKHFLESKTTTYTDQDTGEIRQVEEAKIWKVNLGKQEEFFSVYCNYLRSFFELKYADDIKIVIKLNQWAVFDTGEVSLTPKRRLEITETLGIRNDAISKSLKRLKELKLIDGQGGSFMLNPCVFWKGDKAKRKELLSTSGLKLVFDFNFEKE